MKCEATKMDWTKEDKMAIYADGTRAGVTSLVECDGELLPFLSCDAFGYDSVQTLGSCNKCGLIYHMEVKEEQNEGY